MMIPGPHFRGATVRLTAHLMDKTGNGVTPENVTARIVSPSGSVADYVYGTDENMGIAAVGLYHVDFNANESGRWFVRWVGEDPDFTAVSEDYWHVQHSPILDRISTNLPIIEPVYSEVVVYSVDHSFAEASMYYPVAGI